jgi:hypothetical protein
VFFYKKKTLKTSDDWDAEIDEYLGIPIWESQFPQNVVKMTRKERCVFVFNMDFLTLFFSKKIKNKCLSNDCNYH